jgi:hypothetical protein
MGSSTVRAERRREIKSLRKQLNYIRRHTDFNLLMQSDDLNRVTEEEKIQLRDKTHPNPILQDRFNQAMYLLKEVLTKESRLLELTRNKEEDIPAI